MFHRQAILQKHSPSRRNSTTQTKYHNQNIRQHILQLTPKSKRINTTTQNTKTTKSKSTTKSKLQVKAHITYTNIHLTRNQHLNHKHRQAHTQPSPHRHRIRQLQTRPYHITKTNTNQSSIQHSLIRPTSPRQRKHTTQPTSSITTTTRPHEHHMPNNTRGLKHQLTSPLTHRHTKQQL